MSFAESSNLRKHEKTHTGELRNVQGKPNLCCACGKAFKWASSLSKHMKHHTRHKIFNCPYCSKYYVESRSLNIHLRSHTGKKCEDVFNVFKMKTRLNSRKCTFGRIALAIESQTISHELTNKKYFLKNLRKKIEKEQDSIRPLKKKFVKKKFRENIFFFEKYLILKKKILKKK